MASRAMKQQHREALSMLQAVCAQFARARANETASLPPLRWRSIPHSTQHLARHGLLPIVHWLVERGQIVDVERGVAAAAWAERAFNAERNRCAEQRLIEIVSTLNAAGIATIAHKGPALTRHLYGDAALRSYTDLDLIVNAADLFDAVDAVGALGYEPITRVDTAVRGRFLQAGRQYDMECVHREHGALLELHWRSDPRFFIEAPTVAPIDIAGVRLAQLCDRELLFALLIHGTKHRWARFAWLLDVALLESRLRPDDWAWILRQARRLRCETRLLVGLILVRNIVGRAPPEVDWSGPARRRACRMADAIERELGCAETSPDRSIVQQMRDEHASNDSVGQTVAHGARLAFTPNLRAWQHVSPRQAWPGAAWLARLVRIAARRRAR